MAVLALRQRLRAETHAVHERLHQHELFAAIADGSIAAEDFDRLMARMGGFYAAFDPVMTAANLHARHGGVDYRYQMRRPLFHRTDTPPPVLPEIIDLATLAGAAYVVDGAVLGGQILQRAIAGRLEHPYWDWCASTGALVWRNARALIDTADTGASAADRAVDTANRVFQAFSDHMNMPREEAAA